MYCPNCSTQAVEGAKFCKTCGMNLNAVTQALSGGVVVSDPLREREYKRARKQITDGIHGSSIGAGLLVASAFAFFFLKNSNAAYTASILFALAGIFKLFRGIAAIVDAKVGAKLLDPELQPRGTGGLVPPGPRSQAEPLVRPSQRLSPDMSRTPAAPTRTMKGDSSPAATGTLQPPPAPGLTGTLNRQAAPPAGNQSAPLNRSMPLNADRINREQSSPLKRLDKSDEILSNLRN